MTIVRTVVLFLFFFDRQKFVVTRSSISSLTRRRQLPLATYYDAERKAETKNGESVYCYYVGVVVVNSNKRR